MKLAQDPACRNKVGKKCTASADICRLAHKYQSPIAVDRGWSEKGINRWCFSLTAALPRRNCPPLYVWVDMEGGWMNVDERENGRGIKRKREGEEKSRSQRVNDCRLKRPPLDRGTGIDKWSMRFAFAAKYSLSIR